jgi:hypothetical protein
MTRKSASERALMPALPLIRALALLRAGRSGDRPDLRRGTGARAGKTIPGERDTWAHRLRHRAAALAGPALRSGGVLDRSDPELLDPKYMMNASSRGQLLDKLIEAYVDWCEACTQVKDAHRSWASETGSGGRAAFGRYIAALDAEEQAAELYAELVGRAHRLIAALDAEERAAELYAGLVGRPRKVPRSESPPAEPFGEPGWGIGWP